MDTAEWLRGQGRTQPWQLGDAGIWTRNLLSSGKLCPDNVVEFKFPLNEKVLSDTKSYGTFILLCNLYTFNTPPPCPAAPG